MERPAQCEIRAVTNKQAPELDNSFLLLTDTSNISKVFVVNE